MTPPLGYTVTRQSRDWNWRHDETGVRGEGYSARKRAVANAVEYHAHRMDAVKMWTARCDPHADGAHIVVMRGVSGNNSMTAEGTIYDGRRMQVYVRWDDAGPYIVDTFGEHWRWRADARRAAGSLYREDS